jgi:hypothetical protein
VRDECADYVVGEDAAEGKAGFVARCDSLGRLRGVGS